MTRISIVLEAVFVISLTKSSYAERLSYSKITLISLVQDHKLHFEVNSGGVCSNITPLNSTTINNILEINKTKNNLSLTEIQESNSIENCLQFSMSDTTPHNQKTDSKFSIAKTIKLGFYFCLWYFFTIVYNVSNKRVLNELPLPATVAFIQLVLGIPVFLPGWILKCPNFESVRNNLPVLCKISLMHALGNLATVISLGSGAVSFTHIIKASEPVFSAVISGVILGSYFPIPVYMTLIPIGCGVAMASMKELSFSWHGFCSGMASNFFYQMRIVMSKKELSGENNTLSPANFFRVLTIISALLLFPISVAMEGYKIRNEWNTALARGMDTELFISNLIVSGVSYYCYNEVAFWILGSIHPITHAVGNTIKRVVIILASVLILKSPMHYYSVLGSTVAVLGTFMYSIAQYYYSSSKNKTQPTTF